MVGADKREAIRETDPTARRNSERGAVTLIRGRRALGYAGANVLCL